MVEQPPPALGWWKGFPVCKQTYLEKDPPPREELSQIPFVKQTFVRHNCP